MTAPAMKKQTMDETHLGDYAASQPVSGVKVVQEAFAMNGFSCGNYVHIDESKKTKTKR